MGGRSYLPRLCAGKILEGGVRRVPGWVLKTPPERSNLHRRRRIHGLVLLKYQRRCAWVGLSGYMRLYSEVDSGTGGNVTGMKVWDV